MNRIILLLVAITLSGCGGGGGSSSSSAPPTAAPVTTIAGNYAGTIQDQLAGSGTVTFTLIQNGNAVSGTWASKFANPANNNSGALNGTTSGTQLGVNLTPGTPGACPFAVAAIVNGANISGTYSAFNCSVVDAGSVNVTKQ